MVEFKVQDEHLDIVGSCPGEVQPGHNLSCSVSVRFNRAGLHSLRVSFTVLGPGGRRDFEFTQFQLVPFGEYEADRSVRSMLDVPIRADAQPGTTIYAIFYESAIGELHAEFAVSEVTTSGSQSAPAWAVFPFTNAGIMILAGLALTMSVGLAVLWMRRRKR